MGLLDWLTDGLGSSMGQDATGTGAMLPQTMPDVPPMQPTAPTPPVAPTPAIDPSTTDIGGGMQGAGPAPSPTPAVSTPLPVPRPMAADAGPSALPPALAPTSGAGMPPGPPTSLAPTAPGPTSAPWKLGDQTALGRAIGVDPGSNGFKSAMAGLGEGLTAAGNSKGKSAGQAFGAGAGGALTGASKQDNTQYDQRLKSLTLAVNAQAQGDKAAYNKNYAEYLKGKLENDEKAATPGGKKGSWNKPDSQKFIDAQNALSKDPEVHASQKMLEKLASTGTPQEIAQATAQHNALIQQKQGMYLAGVGLDPAKIQANIQNPPGTPQNPHVITSKQDFDTYVKPGQAYKNPADGKIYIRKGAANAGTDEAAPESPAATAPAPPGPAPGTSASPGGTEDDD